MLFKNGQKIVFTGDSITDADRKRPLGEGLWQGVGNGYVRAFDTMINVLYPDMLFHICNTGWSGNTSRDLLARFDKDVIDLSPDWVVLMIGANDVWRHFDEPGLTSLHVGAEEYRENMVAMLDKMQAAGIRPILWTPYIMEANKNDPLRKELEAFASIVKELAAEREILCVDAQAIFDDYMQYRYGAGISWDRIHPGHIGSMLLARGLLRAIGADRAFI